MKPLLGSGLFEDARCSFATRGARFAALALLVLSGATCSDAADEESVDERASAICPIWDPQCPQGWFVSPTGSAQNEGTIESPWSLKHALACAGGQIKPGHTVNLRGGVYQAPALPAPPFTLTCSGTPSQPIRYRAYPGNGIIAEPPAVIDGAIPVFSHYPDGPCDCGWEPVSVGPGHNVYRSKQSYPNLGHATGFISINGVWMTLIVHGHGSAPPVEFLSSDNHMHRKLDGVGIAKSQSVPAGGNATVNGTHASGGIATLPAPAHVGGSWAQSATVTIFGTDSAGAAISESSPAAVTSYTTKKLFSTVTQLSFSAAVSTMTFGTDSIPHYVGPGLAWDPTDQRIYIRLDNSTAAAQRNRPVLQISDPDPNHHDLRISGVFSIGLLVNARDVIVEGLEIDHFGQALNTGGTGNPGNITFKGLRVRPGYHGARLGHADHVTFDDCVFRAHMPAETFSAAYTDIKGGVLPADNTRKVGLDLGTSTYVTIVNSEFHEFFDGILSTAPTSSSAPRSHHVTIQNNAFIQTWDDAWQMPYGHHDVDIGYNEFFGAGPSRGGPGTGSSNPSSGTIYIHHNVIAPNEAQIFWYRGGASPDGGEPPGFDGVIDAIPLSAHGLPQTGNAYSFPWKLYHNTVVVRDRAPSGGIGIVALGGNLAFLYDGSPHEVYNNIFVDPKGIPLARDFVAHNGHEMYDGNVFAGGWRATPTPVKPIYRLVHTSSSVLPVVNGESAATPLWSPAALRDPGLPILADTQSYPIPSFGPESYGGWEQSGVSLPDLQFDATYRPLSCSACATGAVSLTASGWPGTSVYQPWRGAVAP